MDDWEEPVEVAVLIKAAPEIGQKHGETVCVAGIDLMGRWHRLYPVPWRDLRPDQRFHRWDIIQVPWRRPGSDKRVESKRIDHTRLQITGKVPERERVSLVARAMSTSLAAEKAAGRTLALIRPVDPRFRIERFGSRALQKATRRRQELRAQADLFAASILEPEQPPFRFSYEFEHDGATVDQACIDWETERTFFKWRELYGEEGALRRLQEQFGDTLPRRGLAFAMGTHRVTWYNRWLLSGLIQVAEPAQAILL